MKFVFIDYSDAHFRDAEGKAPPPERQGKFIQVRDGETEYLVLSPRELSAFHANIAERFFTSMGIRGSYNRKRDHFVAGHTGWTIVGGGHWTVDENAGELKLTGISMAYGKFDSRGLEDRLKAAGLRHRILIYP